MAHLSVCLLGTFAATLDGEPVRGFDSNKVRALLVYLTVEADHPHRRETLATLLWPENPDRVARTNLRNALANLRKVLYDQNADQPFILVNQDTLQFNRECDADVDVSTFNSLFKVDQPSIQRLEQAVALYHGSFLQGFSLKDSLAFDDWALIMRERLHRKVLSALRNLSSHFTQQGDYVKACELAREQVEMQPWREEAYRDLMRLLAISGQRSEALVQYETCRQTLQDELAITPSQETKALYEQIRDNQLAEVVVPITEIHPVPPNPKHNLPVQLTPFVGRQANMASIGKLIEDPACRLLTLVGPGGSGKTRLSIEVGTQWVDRFEHGVLLVSLASLESTDSLISALARALTFTFYGGMDPRQQILSYLQGKNFLLIFDNFEHLLAPSVSLQADTDKKLSATTVVLDILKTAPDVKILVTSRVRLNVQGEMLFLVSEMLYPEFLSEATTGITAPQLLDFSQYSAVELFVLSALRNNPDFELTSVNQVNVVRICHLVNGMPLAILLAAGWTRVLSLSEIAEQIQESFDFLETELRDLPERQRSMRSVFNHTWSLLSVREREIISSFSIFRGETSRTAIQAVTGVNLRELRSLVDKSLLQMNANGYYEMHELLRQYVVEQLGMYPDAVEQIQDRHSHFYLTAFEKWVKAIKSPQQETALFEISIELENIHLAWSRALDKERIHQLGQASFGLTSFFMNYRLLREGEQWFRVSVERIEEIIEGYDISEFVLTNSENLRVFAIILAHYVFIDYWTWGRSDRTRHNIEKSRFLLDKLENAGFDIRQNRADFIYSTIDACEGPKLDMQMQSLEINRALGNRWGTACALWDLGWIFWMMGNNNKAKQMWKEGLAISRQLGAPRLIVVFLKSFVYGAWESGNYGLTQDFCEEELALRQTLLKNAGMENVFQSMALITLNQGQLEKAEYYANACITLSKEINWSFHTEVGLRRLGLVLMATGEYIKAMSALSESVDITRQLGQSYDVTSSSVRLAEANLHLGQYEQSCNLVQECLNLAQDIGAQRNISFCQLLLGRLALVNGEFLESITLLQQGINILEGMGPRRELGPAYADLSIASLRLGKHTQAKQHLKTALYYAVITGDFVAHVYVLPVAALFFTEMEQKEKAKDLFSLASQYPMVANSRWFVDVIGDAYEDIVFPSVVDNDAAAHTDEQLTELHSTVKNLLITFV